MESPSRAEQQWVVQPLIDVGVDVDEIGHLLFRLAFEAVVSEGRDTLAGAVGLVADRSAEVRAAWAEVIGRLLVLDAPP